MKFLLHIKMLQCPITCPCNDIDNIYCWSIFCNFIIAALPVDTPTLYDVHIILRVRIQHADVGRVMGTLHSRGLYSLPITMKFLPWKQYLTSAGLIHSAMTTCINWKESVLIKNSSYDEFYTEINVSVFFQEKDISESRVIILQSVYVESVCQ